MLHISYIIHITKPTKSYISNSAYTPLLLSHPVDVTEIFFSSCCHTTLTREAFTFIKSGKKGVFFGAFCVFLPAFDPFLPKKISGNFPHFGGGGVSGRCGKNPHFLFFFTEGFPYGRTHKLHYFRPNLALYF